MQIIQIKIDQTNRDFAIMSVCGIVKHLVVCEEVLDMFVHNEWQRMLRHITECASGTITLTLTQNKKQDASTGKTFATMRIALEADRTSKAFVVKVACAYEP